MPPPFGRVIHIFKKATQVEIRNLYWQQSTGKIIFIDLYDAKKKGGMV